MIWTLLPGAVFLADGCLKKKAEEELKENEQIPVCKGHIVLRKCHNRGVAGGGMSNWYDRHKRGYVTDYVSFRFGPEKFRRLVFNVSDFCIFFGLALLTAISCRESR